MMLGVCASVIQVNKKLNPQADDESPPTVSAQADQTFFTNYHPSPTPNISPS